MLESIIRKYAHFVTHRSGWVLLIAAIIGVVSVRLSMGIEVRPSRMDMVPQNDPDVVAWKHFTEDFNGMSRILMVVEGPKDESRKFVEDAAAALKPETKWVRAITYKFDTSKLEAQGLYLQTQEKLAEIEKDLIDLGPLVREIASVPTITRVLTYLADEVGDDEAPPQETGKAIKGVEFIQDVVRALTHAMTAPADPERASLFPSLLPRTKQGKELDRDEGGYLVSKSGQRLLVLITPTVELNPAKKTEEMLEVIEPKLDAVKAKHPGVNYVLTGGAMRSLEEEIMVKHDMSKTALAAGLGVILLCRMFFQGILPGLLLDFGLWLMIIVNGAVTRVFIGHINLIGAVFIPLLLGLGEDFGNYLMLTYQDSGKEEGPDTMEEAIVTSMRGCFMGALTTAAVFYSLWFHDFVAYREMGIICGNGIMLAWLANYALLPALMMQRLRWKWLHNKARGVEIDQRLTGLGRLVHALSRPRVLVLAIAIAATVVSRNSVNEIRFDYNLTNLLSQKAQTVEYDKVLHDEFGLSTEFEVISTVNLDDVYTVSDALENNPVVANVETLSMFVPRDVAAKRDAVQRIAKWGLERPRPVATAPAESAAETATALDHLKDSLKRPRRLANMSESKELHAALDLLEKQIDEAKALLAKVAPADATKAYAHLSEGVRHDLEHFVTFLGSAATAVPYTLETLPAEIKERFISQSGRLVTYVSPAQELSTEDEAHAFYTEMRRIEALPAKGQVKASSDKAYAGPSKPIEAAGVPMIVFITMEQIRSGFHHAAIGAMVICFLLVLADLQQVGLALLAMLPVMLGATWMTGWMAYHGMPWNPLDSIAIPILPGCAVAFSVNIIHRFLHERSLLVTMASTGRAALYSSFTTCVGFSALLLANHRGLGSFGRVMVVGDAFCCLACLCIVPILITYLVPERRDADHSDRGADPAKP